MSQRIRTILSTTAALSFALAVLPSASGAAPLPEMVKDMSPGPENSVISGGADLNGLFVFDGRTDETGYDLWRSDGTAEGTRAIELIPGPSQAAPYGFTKLRDVLLFSGGKASGQSGTPPVDWLWTTDGTARGTKPVKRMEDYGPRNLTRLGDRVLFSSEKGRKRRLWKTDGTMDGTKVLANVDFWAPKRIGDKVLFVEGSAKDGLGIWRTDGTSAGTRLVKAIEGDPEEVTRAGKRIFFVIKTEEEPGEYVQEPDQLWKSDGTKRGTQPVNLINGEPEYEPYFPEALYFLTGVGKNVFFAGKDDINGTELWKSDGTAGGTQLVKDINPGPEYSRPRYFKGLEGTLYFKADDGSNGAELWRSDGSKGGTGLVADINPGPEGSFPRYFVRVGKELLFSAFDETHGREPRRTDGTEEGTDLIADINEGPANSNDYFGFERVRDGVFFEARTAEFGQELWRLDLDP